MSASETSFAGRIFKFFSFKSHLKTENQCHHNLVLRALPLSDAKFPQVNLSKIKSLSQKVTIPNTSKSINIELNIRKSRNSSVAKSNYKILYIQDLTERTENTLYNFYFALQLVLISKLRRLFHTI